MELLFPCFLNCHSLADVGWLGWYILMALISSVVVSIVMKIIEIVNKEKNVNM